MNQLHEESSDYSIQALCSLFGYSKQAYYKYFGKGFSRAANKALTLEMVDNVRKDMSCIGGRKLHHILKGKMRERCLGRDALFNLLREYGYLIRRRRTKAVITNSRHHFRRFKNLIKGWKPTAPNQLYVSDITYIDGPNDSFYYLSLVTDAYSRKIVGWHLATTLEAEGPIQALKIALSEWTQEWRLVHHSDWGIQYCCNEYVSILNKYQVKISMTENGDPLENAIAERVNGILKTEWIEHMQFKDIRQARDALIKVIEDYNTKRPHYSIDMKTPEDAHLQYGEIKQKWKNYYKKKDEYLNLNHRSGSA